MTVPIELTLLDPFNPKSHNLKSFQCTYVIKLTDYVTLCSIFTLFIQGPPNTFFQLVLISWMITLSSCLCWQIISFILPPNEYGCVYAWTTLGSRPAIDLQKLPIWEKKNFLFRWTHLDLGGYLNKQNCRIWGTENPHAYTEKPTQRSHYQPQSWCRLATSELRFDTVGLLFVGCRQR